MLGYNLCYRNPVLHCLAGALAGDFAGDLAGALRAFLASAFVLLCFTREIFLIERSLAARIGGDSSDNLI